MDYALPKTRLAPRHAAFVAPARPRAQLWRTITGLLLAVAIYLCVMAGAFTVYALLHGVAAAETLLAAMAVASTPASLFAVLASFGAMFIGLGLACRIVLKRGLASLIGRPARALRDFARAVGVFGVIYGAALLVYLSFNPTVPNLPILIWLGLVPLTVLGLIVQTGAEELLFRGYLQQQLAARFSSPWLWAVLPSAIFGFLHLDPARLGATAPYAVAAAVIFGLIAADLTARSGSLGAAWGAHFANNFFALAVLSLDGTMTGFALRVTNYRIDELAPNALLLASDLLPMVAAWWILRRWLDRV